ncbi:hypothetical protein D3C87_1777880 [compost metagenome]
MHDALLCLTNQVTAVPRDPIEGAAQVVDLLNANRNHAVFGVHFRVLADHEDFGVLNTR